MEQVHQEGIIHRDVKPENFLIGNTKANEDKIHIIDFGIAKSWKNNEGHHIPYADGRTLTGTPRHASLNAQVGVEQTRRDDLESIGNMIIDLAKGTLPWQTVQGKTKVELYDNIKKCKQNTSIQELCSGLPKEFQEYMDYCRSLRFDQEPNYQQCIDLFAICMKNQNLIGSDFCWKKQTKAQSSFSMPKNKFINKISAKYTLSQEQQKKYTNGPPPGKISSMQTPSKIQEAKFKGNMQPPGVSTSITQSLGSTIISNKTRNYNPSQFTTPKPQGNKFLNQMNSTFQSSQSKESITKVSINGRLSPNNLKIKKSFELNRGAGFKLSAQQMFSKK